MKILVTGGAGFIGSHLVDALLDRGHQVDVIDNFITGRQDNLNPQARLHRLDIRDPEVVDRIAGAGYEIIFHLAAQLDVRKSVDDPVYDAQVNILGSLNLLQGAVQARTRKFIFASTGGACYGEQLEFPASEQHPLQPISPYGVTKVSIEKYLHYYQQVHRLDYAIMRYANVYGPRQNTHGEAGVIAVFCDRLLTGQQPYVNGDGEQTRDFVHVADVVQANLLAMEHGRNAAYNVGTGVETSINQVYDIINTHAPTAFPREHRPGRAGEQKRSVLDASKIRSTLGWRPQYDFDSGMQQTIQWFLHKNGLVDNS